MPIPGSLGCWEELGVRGEGTGVTAAGGTFIAAQPRIAEETPSHCPSLAADAESQDPDSTGQLESEAPRDYFLKCE